MRFVGDEPIVGKDKDELGLSTFADLIEASIRSTQTPFVYGILGDWGTGKTSTMCLLKTALEQDNSTDRKFVPIWFNAWLYENETNVIFPLLYAIRGAHAELKAGDGESKFKTAFKIVTATALSISDLGLRALTKKVFDEAITIKDLKEHLEFTEAELDRLDGVLSSWTDKVAQLQKAFAQMVAEYAHDYAKMMNCKKDDVVFIILIDDLDRCLPSTTLSILESVKNFLSVPQCVFVLGLNPSVVYAGIQHKFLGVSVSGREYLEKILNYAFYVPEPSADEIEKFAVLRLNDLIDDAAIKDGLSNELEAFGKVLSDCRYTNPRKIKRVLNRYLLFLARYRDQLGEYDIKNIVKLIVQAEYYPDLFQVFLSNTEQVEALKKIGTKDFHLAEFQAATGISISSEYAHLGRIRELFNVSNPLKPKADLQKHASDVFAIARLR